PPPPRHTLFPYTTLFRSIELESWNRFEHGAGFLDRLRALETRHEGVVFGELIEIHIEERHSLALDVRAARAHQRALRLDAQRKRSEEHTSELQSLAYLVC